MSPGLTFGTEVIVSSSRRCGCDSGVGRGPTYPLSRGAIPGNSDVEMSEKAALGCERGTCRWGKGPWLTIFPVFRVKRVCRHRRRFLTDEWPKDDIGVGEQDVGEDAQGTLRRRGFAEAASERGV